VKVINNTYRFFLQIVLVVLLGACSANTEGAEEKIQKNTSDVYNETSTIEDKSEVQPTAAENASISVDYKKWKKKAKQQLESVQDYALILQDSSLDDKFSIEIEKELRSLFDYRDTTMFDIDQKKLNFKKFKELKVENGDTLSIDFKNVKQNLKARFIIVDESKSFGETIEIVKLLKLISIKEDL